MTNSIVFKSAVDQTLTQLIQILEKAAAHCAARNIAEEAFLSARIFPDMLPFTRQIQIVSDLARRGAARLLGQTPESTTDTEKSFAELVERLQATKAVALAASDADIDARADETLTLPLGPQTVTFTSTTYLNKFVLPNLHFHATIAYALLRHGGVELGKADFLGAL